MRWDGFEIGVDGTSQELSEWTYPNLMNIRK